MPTRLIELAENLPRCRVLLVGDLMVDRYLYGNAERLSPEAPVPVLHFQHEELRLGGAASVAADLAALGATVVAVGVVGNDAVADSLRQLLTRIHADVAGLVAADRPTTCKMRLVGSAQHRHPQQMIRLDYEDHRPVDPATQQKLIDAAIAALPTVDLICIEDYDKGVVTPALCAAVLDAARQAGKAVLIDPARIADYGKYAGATCLKLNRPEAARATGLPVDTPEQFRPAAEKLLTMLNLEAVVLTLDKQGAYVASAGDSSRRIPPERRLLGTRPRQVYDVTGAGDMAFAMLAIARVAGATWEEATALANIAGGLEVEKFGVVPITPAEIIQELLAEVHLRQGKQRNLPDLLAEISRHRASGKRIVFTNGCFDLIHLGHVKYFQFAKRQGDLLIVGVNTDAGIRRLKGEKRPIIAEADRISVLEELESIDYLIPFDADTPLALIEAIRPDVLVKGADYTKEQVVGWDVVEASGGSVALAPLVDGRSTSAVIGRILDAYGKRMMNDE
jgi:D-beta-D-heptose 7-phosphate kinase/D-beta-D-heptose 1-phosphate adenosyltransferase